MTSTPYIAFKVLFLLINNRNVDIAYSNWKKLPKIFLQYMKLLEFGYKSPQVYSSLKEVKE